VKRRPGAVLRAALKHDPPMWAVADLLRLDVIVLAERHGLLPILAQVAADHRVIPNIDTAAIPLDRTNSLSAAAVLLLARAKNRSRHADLDAIRDIATEELARAEVAFRHLKGGALRHAGVWQDFTARPTRDVDILVSEVQAIPRIESALLGHGFELSNDVAKSPAWEDDHHDLPLVFPGRSGSLELHSASLVRRHRDRIVMDFPSRVGEEDLVTTLRHIVLHCQMQDDALLEFRLPIVPLLDVAFAVEAGLVDSRELISGLADPVARRAVRIHLGLASRLRGTAIPSGKVKAGRWWFSAFLFDRPRLAYLVREAAFVPRSLSRPILEARHARKLSPLGLARARSRFLLERIPQGIRGIPQSKSETERPIEHNPGGNGMIDSPIATGVPEKKPGFEAVWSASGLVLVNLSTDMLHHLNGPAAVVYELVDTRSLAELVDTYSALAGISGAAAEEVVETALESLRGIDAVTADGPAE